MNIRKATLFDVPALVALNRSVQEMHAAALPKRFRTDVADRDVACAFSEMIQSPSSCWILAEEKAPVAFLNAEFRERAESWCGVAQKICYLGGIAVAPPFRRTGIARALVMELKTEAMARGTACIELDVWTFNESAHQAFAALGFRPLMQRMTLGLVSEGRT